RIAAHVSVGSRNRNNEGAGIEVLAWPARDYAATEGRIPGWPYWIAAVAIVARIESELRSKRKAGLQALDSRQAPSAREFVGRSFQTFEKVFTLSHRQFVASIHRG